MHVFRPGARRLRDRPRSPRGPSKAGCGVRMYASYPQLRGGSRMCRNIKTLFNFEPPVTDDEIRAASLQFVRKVSGFHSPSRSNESAFLGATDEIEAASRKLLHSLHTNTPTRNREEQPSNTNPRPALR